MQSWYNKHGKKIHESHALSVIHDKIETAKCRCEEGENYLPELEEAYVMIHDYLLEKGVDPNQIKR